MTDLCERALHHAGGYTPISHSASYLCTRPTRLRQSSRHGSFGQNVQHGTPTSQDKHSPQTPCSRVVTSSATGLNEPSPMQTPAPQTSTLVNEMWFVLWVDDIPLETRDDYLNAPALPTFVRRPMTLLFHGYLSGDRTAAKKYSKDRLVHLLVNHPFLHPS